MIDSYNTNVIINTKDWKHHQKKKVERNEIGNQKLYSLTLKIWLDIGTLVTNTAEKIVNHSDINGNSP